MHLSFHFSFAHHGSHPIHLTLSSKELSHLQYPMLASHTSPHIQPPFDALSRINLPTVCSDWVTPSPKNFNGTTESWIQGIAKFDYTKSFLFIFTIFPVLNCVIFNQETPVPKDVYRHYMGISNQVQLRNSLLNAILISQFPKVFTILFF